MITELTGEVQVLLSLLAGIKPVDTSSQTVDWPALADIAERHCVVPALVEKLNTGSHPVPDETKERLHLYAAKISARSIVLTNELLSAVKLLEDHGIPVIAYKGPALAKALFGKVDARDFDDIDVLVQKRDLPGAREILLKEGFLPKPDLANLTPSQERAFFDFSYSYDLVRRHPNYHFEIHWAVVPRTFSLNLDYDRIWKNSVLLSMKGRQVRIFAPEDMLLILCISGARKTWDRFSRILDVAAAVNRFPDLDWKRVHEFARLSGAVRILHLGLSLASKLFQARLPTDVQASISDDIEVARLTELMISRLVHPQAGRLIHWKDQFQPLHMKMRERFSDRFCYFLRITFTPGVGEWKALKLPGPLYFLYHILRPARLIWKTVKRLTHSNG